MKVLVEPCVNRYLHAFYALSMMTHPSLSEEYVLKRIEELESHILFLGEYADIFHQEPYKEDWKQKHYQEYLYQDFHFAYKVEQRLSGEHFVHVYEVVNSKLNYNPADVLEQVE